MENTITAWYANNAIYQVGLNLSLSYDEWLKIVEREDFNNFLFYLIQAGLIDVDHDLLKELRLGKEENL